MNSLLSNSLSNIFNKWQEYKDVIINLTTQDFNSSINVHGLKGSLNSYFIADYCNTKKNKTLQSFQYNAAGYSSQTLKSKNNNIFSCGCENLLVVVPTERDADIVASDINAFFPEIEVSILPGWGTVPYKSLPIGSITFGKRAGVFAKMLTQKNQVFIVTQRVFQTPVPEPDYIKSLIFSLKVGNTIDTVQIAQKLSSCGYTRVPKVSVRGEFSLKGEVLDIFLPQEPFPYRIVFDFDTIENIKSFDIDTQKTSEVVSGITVYPMKEILWDKQMVEKLNGIFDNYIEDSKKNDESIESVCLPFSEQAIQFKDNLILNLFEKGESEGEELFYPLLWNKKYTILDYLDDSCTVVYYDYDKLENAQESLDREFIGMYRKTRLELPIFSPEKISYKFDEIQNKFSRCIKFRTLSIENNTLQGDNLEKDNKLLDENINISENSSKTTENHYYLNCYPSQSYFGNINLLKDELDNLQKQDWKIFIYTNNENQSLRIHEILKKYTQPEEKSVFPVTLIDKEISEGFIIPDIKVKVIHENEIFARKKYIAKTSHRVKSKAIDTFVDLNPGDYIVHVSYGIGIFKGIDRVRAIGNERDYIKLEYADEEFVFVPIEQVNLIQRYIGNDGNNPKIDRIGSKSWENRKNKVKQAVEDLAKKLIDLYSRRKASKGFPFPKDTEWQLTFEAAFPYEDTPDQITVTEEIKADMEKPVPMDRLVCGDVGYGKTEIAMRAAFKAVMGGKQVAFLAPTTILAEQHYENCVERFQNFPVKIAHMSRFVSNAEQKKILAKLAEGQIDILIGTHRIIQKDVNFKNLGLMIIDEEQRSGVKDKEKLKVLKNNIDSLAMSATPIPRTLHMSLLKIRDMSLLTTPPQNRQPIETVIDAYNENKVADVIRQEIQRGGQVFYLHNRVESLNETRLKLERLMPELLIEVAHGQMTSEELDDIFRRFKLGGFHVLVATTIIENGIDIPNVNTIIIDRADMYGVSQLYQLRGRVGRSDKKAYAYLLYPGNKSLSEIAMKRLQVISDFTELGSGFKIAMKDMEIRGAGNLLGRDQSGNVYSVGFDMYVRLLNDAVLRLTEQEDYKEQNEVLLELEYTGFIPDSYVQNPQTKMEIYKKIAAIQEHMELDGVYNELSDRFGPIPDEVLSLLALAEIRIIGKKLNIASIKERKGVIQVEFAKVSDISIDKVLGLIHESAGSVKLDPVKPNMLFLNIGKIGLKEKSEYIRQKLERLV